MAQGREGAVSGLWHSKAPLTPHRELFLSLQLGDDKDQGVPQQGLFWEGPCGPESLRPAPRARLGTCQANVFTNMNLLLPH